MGLIKSYCWTKYGELRYEPKTDMSANGMFKEANVKGVIDSMPEIPSIYVWKKGHIGVYIGGGQVIEAKGTKFEVMQSPLKGKGSSGWTRWLKCPCISSFIVRFLTLFLFI